jgi:predicted dehydrogenase
LKTDFGYPEYFDPESRLFNRDKGGGSLLDRGIYTLSLAYHLIGRPNHFNSYAAIGSSGVDDQSAYLLGYENGAIANLASTLKTYGTNEVVIMGTRGQIKIHAPFYRPHRVSVQHFPEPHSNQPGALDEPQGLKARLKRMPFVQKIVRSTLPLLEFLIHGKSVRNAFSGHGYHFEITEVTQCLQQGETESQIMPLDETLEIMKIMDAMREQWGLQYPQE